MILGNGLLARAFGPRFAHRRDALVFASGVSNSLETSQSQFDREFALLCRVRREWDGRLIYFGSCSVADEERQHTEYAQHKLAMEKFVASRAKGLVVRLPQVVGATNNPNTLTNFLHRKIDSGEEFTVWAHAERNLVDVDDVAAITEAIVDRMSPTDSGIVAIASECPVLMPELVEIFERIIGKSANCRLIPKGGRLHIDTTRSRVTARELGLDLGQGYIERVLGKYYGSSL